MAESVRRLSLQAGASGQKLEGDYDVFGDRERDDNPLRPVTRLVTSRCWSNFRRAAQLVLSGDAVHFKSNWDNRRVPSINADKDKTVASMQRIADVMAKEKARLWINHDKAQRDALKMAPGFYD